MTTSAAPETAPVSCTDRTFCAHAVAGSAATMGKSRAKTRQAIRFMGSALVKMVASVRAQAVDVVVGVVVVVVVVVLVLVVVVVVFVVVVVVVVEVVVVLEVVVVVVVDVVVVLVEVVVVVVVVVTGPVPSDSYAPMSQVLTV